VAHAPVEREVQSFFRDLQSFGSILLDLVKEGQHELLGVLGREDG